MADLLTEEEPLTQAPPKWSAVEASDKYKNSSNVERRTAFSKWDDYSRKYAQQEGLWDDPKFQEAYQSKAGEVVKGLRTYTDIYQESAINSYNVVRNTVRAAKREWMAGGVALELQKPNPDLKKIADTQKTINEYAPSAEFNTTWDDNVAPRDSWKAFAKDPIGNVAQLLAGSFGAQIKATAPSLHKIPEKMVQFGAVGTGLGALAGPGAPITGTAMGVAGLAGGFKQGLSEAQMAGSYAVEYGGDMIDSLRKAGVDVTNYDQMKAAFDDPAKIKEIKEHAQKKAVPVAVGDGILGVIAGSMFPGSPLVKGPVKKMMSKIGQWAGEMLFQGAGSATAEAVSQVASEGKIYSPKSVIAEFGADVVADVVGVGVGRAATALVNAKPEQQAKFAEVAPIAKALKENNAPLTAQAVVKNTLKEVATEDPDLLSDLIEQEAPEGTFAEEPDADARFAPPPIPPEARTPEEALAAVPPTLEPKIAPVTPESGAIAPVSAEIAPVAESSTGLREMGAKMGGAVVGNLYDTLFAKLQAGDLTENRSPSKILQEAAPAFAEGRIKSAEDLRIWVNTESSYAPKTLPNEPTRTAVSVEPVPGAAEPAQPVLPEAQPQPSPQAVPADVAPELGETGAVGSGAVVTSGGRPAVVADVRGDGAAILKQTSEQGRAAAQPDIDSTNPNAKFDVVDKIQAKIDSGKPLGYGTSGDKVTVGYDVTADSQIDVRLTAQEQKQLKNSEADLKLADTQEERTQAKASIQGVLKAAVSRRINGVDLLASNTKPNEQQSIQERVSEPPGAISSAGAIPQTVPAGIASPVRVGSENTVSEAGSPAGEATAAAGVIPAALPTAVKPSSQSTASFTPEQNAVHDAFVAQEPPPLEKPEEAQHFSSWAQENAPKRPIILYNDKGQTAVITPSSKPGRKLQVTFMDTGNEGISEAFHDIAAQSVDEGVAEAYRRGFTDTQKYKNYDRTGKTSTTGEGIASPDTQSGVGQRPGELPGAPEGIRAEVPSPGTGGGRPVTIRAWDKTSKSVISMDAKADIGLLRDLRAQDGIYKALIRCL